MIRLSRFSARFLIAMYCFCVRFLSLVCMQIESMVCSMYSSSLIRSSAILCSGGSQSDLRTNGILGGGGSPGFFFELKKYSFLTVVANSSNKHLVSWVTFLEGTGQNFRPFERTFLSASVRIILVKFMILPSS